MQTALTAINFYTQQNDLSSQYRENKMQARINNLHTQCNAKLQQVHLAYQKVRWHHHDDVHSLAQSHRSAV